MWDDQVFLRGIRHQISICSVFGGEFHTLMYMRLSTLIPRNSGNWARHFSKKLPILSPFLH